MIYGERIRLRAQERDDLPIGNTGIMDHDTISRSAELGIQIGEKAYWNKGYGTEAVELMLKHSFLTLNLNRVFLQVFENNPSAIRSYEKAGFVHEGRLREAVFRSGDYLDVFVMSVLKSEWMEKNNI